MYQEGKKKHWLLRLAGAALLAAALWLGADRWWGRDLSRQTVRSIREAVSRSAAQCYAVEGAYPSSLEYLEKNYGLVLNHDRYYIVYEAFSSNLPPTVEVLEKG